MTGPAAGQRATSASAPTSCTSTPVRMASRQGPCVDLGLVDLEVVGAVRGGGQHLERAVDVDEHGCSPRGEGGDDPGEQPGQCPGDVEVGADHRRVGPREDVRDARACHVDSIS